MSNIQTLIPDIYFLLDKKGTSLDVQVAKSLADNLTKRFQERIEGPARSKPTLRLSGMGPRCPKALWGHIHANEKAEPLAAHVHLRFAYGDVIEALIIALAKAAGHKVEGEQDEIRLDGIVGHRDCIIDGNLVDIKSCSSRMYLKFKSKTLSKDDPFGYLDQLDGYLVGSADDPLVTVKDRGYLLAVEREMGHMCLVEHIARPENIRKRIDYYKRVVASSTPPACECRSIPYGKSGNMVLDTRASYESMKWFCHPFLRKFHYEKKPLYFTKVVRVPDVTEVDRYGKIVYN